MATKELSVVEKMHLLHCHGEKLAGAFRGGRLPDRADLIESAERAMTLIKSIPKTEFAIEDR